MIATNSLDELMSLVSQNSYVPLCGEQFDSLNKIPNNIYFHIVDYMDKHFYVYRIMGIEQLKRCHQCRFIAECEMPIPYTWNLIPYELDGHHIN